MLSDPLRARRNTLIVAALAAAWMAIYVMFNDEIVRAMGDGAHALVFVALVALVALIACLIVAAMFSRLARERAALKQGETLARWRVTRQEWDAFAQVDAPATRRDRRRTLWLILFFAAVIPAGMALTGKDPKILFIIALFIMGVGLLGYGLGRRLAGEGARYRDGEVSLGRDGVIVNGAFHSWSLIGSGLESATVDETKTPAQIEIVYSFLTRAGLQCETVRAPIPAVAAPAAQAAVGRLRNRRPVAAQTA